MAVWGSAGADGCGTRSMGSAGGAARTRLLAQGVDAELEGAAVLPHEVPVQQVGVRACQAGQHLLPRGGGTCQDILPLRQCKTWRPL